ncbi:hypothetical protein A6V39_05025 [Candidatus Mycoplasma haematobovis]|uniref:Uncharacterized protein n=1 Tax=Candidatus Mycoplasma haematobovis TaxID=432608 RepID=A0A1A9QDL5_9MOLU|nr:hypothetical protein [Candidatus Mycoplasma haematobovis]OAL09790.1 hypothetical protein A6V39_05025 [Candidatus Mycoplasma haematobovis]
MLGTTIKVGAGVAVLTAVSASSYFIRGYYNTERITHRITNGGMTLLTSWDDDKEWLKRWKEYLNGDKNVWQLADYAQAKANSNVVPKSFKNKCSDSAYLAIEGNESLFSQVKDYCTKSFKITDLLKEEKVTLLKQGDSNDLWKAAWGKYLNDNKNSNPLEIDKWNLSITKNKNNLPSDYSSKCINTQGREVRTKRDQHFISVKNWCTQIN